jgi:DNA-binding NarL/FixJ family response regulator
VVTTVLLVDDHPLVRSGLSALLAASEHIEVVGEAADGRRAVALAGQLCPDVVLMDLSMPHLDGVSATRQILERSPVTRVVVLTSFTEDERRKDALAAGAAAYLVKDCDPRDLIGTVRRVGSGTAPEAPRPPTRRWTRLVTRWADPNAT